MELYNFYYSEKQAALYGETNKQGGFSSFGLSSSSRYIRQKVQQKVNRVNGKPYTCCAKEGINHNSRWDDLKLIDTADFSCVTHGPDDW